MEGERAPGRGTTAPFFGHRVEQLSGILNYQAKVESADLTTELKPGLAGPSGSFPSAQSPVEKGQWEPGQLSNPASPI